MSFMDIFTGSKKSSTTTVTGFLQADIDKFMRQGLNLSSSSFNMAKAPTTQTFVSSIRKSEIAPFGLASSCSDFEISDE